jgi:hypothetical protein
MVELIRIRVLCMLSDPDIAPKSTSTTYDLAKSHQEKSNFRQKEKEKRGSLRSGRDVPHPFFF